MSRRERGCAAAVVLLLVGAGVLWFFLSHSGTRGTVANVYQDGVCIHSVDLYQVTEGYTFTVTSTEGIENLVAVEPGRIAMLEADCPDHVCTDTGWIAAGSRQPIVCLPARLVIQIEADTVGDTLQIDGVSG